MQSFTVAKTLFLMGAQWRSRSCRSFYPPTGSRYSRLAFCFHPCPTCQNYRSESSQLQYDQDTAIPPGSLYHLVFSLSPSVGKMILGLIAIQLIEWHVEPSPRLTRTSKVDCKLYSTELFHRPIKTETRSSPSVRTTFG